MKRTKAKVGAAALVTAVLSVGVATSAQADFTPQSNDVVGVGSDTIEIALNNVANGATIGSTSFPGYNAAASARVVSFNATNPSVAATSPDAHDVITLKVGTTPITRPNGSGAGKALLYGSGNNTAVNFARSSSALSSAEAAAGLRAYPFGLDQLEAGVAKTTNAPAALSIQQLVAIYSGAVTNWSQLGGQAGVIDPLIPQSGSGTRSFFEAQLKAANGGVAVTYAGTVREVQEHDPTVFNGNPNAVAPFSVGRAGIGQGPTYVHLESGTAGDGNPSFLAKRAVYDVVRGADANKAFVKNLFGSDGYLCSPAAQQLIEAGGIKQLASPLDGGVCGVAVTTATDVTNFLTN